jgi:purine-binding chemotaxis protein CheW
MTQDHNAQYLTFHLAAEVFAIDIRSVREIIQYGAMSTLPLMPSFVRGVIILRGSVVPVIDMHARFGRPAAQVGKKTCVVIILEPDRAFDVDEMTTLCEASQVALAA